MWSPKQLAAAFFMHRHTGANNMRKIWGVISGADALSARPIDGLMFVSSPDGDMLRDHPAWEWIEIGRRQMNNDFNAIFDHCIHLEATRW